MARETVAFKGRGPVRAAPYTKPDNLQRLGNNSQLEFAIDYAEVNMTDYEGEGGGLAATDSDVEAVTVGMNILQFSASTMALGMRGVVTDAPTAQQTDEPHYAYVGALMLLNYNPDSGQTVTVAENGAAWAGTTDVVASTATLHADWVSPGNSHIYECTTAGTTGASEPTWPTNGGTVTDGSAVWTDRGDVSSLVSGTDYNVSRAGIVIPDSGSKVTDGMPLKVTYTPHADQKLIDALKDSGTEHRLVFDGMNRTKDNRACTIVMWKVKFDPTEGMNFISDEFGEMPLSAKLLKDDAIPAAGATSQYYQIKWRDAA